MYTSFIAVLFSYEFDLRELFCDGSEFITTLRAQTRTPRTTQGSRSKIHIQCLILNRFNCGLDIIDSLYLKFYSVSYDTRAYSANYYCLQFLFISFVHYHHQARTRLRIVQV